MQKYPRSSNVWMAWVRPAPDMPVMSTRSRSCVGEDPAASVASIMRVTAR